MSLSNSGVRFGNVTTTTYGSTDTGGNMEDITADLSSSEEEEENNFDDSVRSLLASQQQNLAGVNAANVWTSVRNKAVEGADAAGSGEPERHYDLVPSQIKDNVKLVNDPNIEQEDVGTGRLYYKASAFYNSDEEPAYALTMHPDIYQQILNEVADATSTPCGLYFCCHGGDGAHTGVSHDDYVDIKLAWVLVTIVFGGMLFLFRLDNEL